MAEHKGSSGRGGITLAILALMLIIGSIVVPGAAGGAIPRESQLLLIGFGIVLLIVALIMLVIARLYHQASADMALVVTGFGGLRTVIDGGALVIPLLQNLMHVSLRSMRFEVARNGTDALITKDYLRADVKAEFYLRVPKEPQAVTTAATSMGSGAMDHTAVEALIFEKLDSHLRQVAAGITLQGLLTDRVAFIESVTQHARGDLEKNGLELESVTISRLDQTPAHELRPEENIFDAQAAKAIAEIVQQQRVERNRIQTAADQEIKAQDVMRDKYVFERDVERAEAEAARNQQIQVAQAMATQQAATVSAEQARLASLAEVERDRAIQVATIEMQRAQEVANQQREQAVRSAEIVKEQTVEVAARQKEIAIAAQETSRAQAQAEQLAAEAERTRRDQEVVTVQVTAAAEREKVQRIIQAQAAAEQQRVSQQTEADIQAYQLVKVATAQQEAAEREAAAQLTRSEAAKRARELEAEGDRAVQLVPVHVSRQQVEVEEARVAVNRQDLSNKAEFETIARELQVELARIEAEKQVEMARAQAMGEAFGHTQMQVWGTPEQVSRLSGAFLKGQSAGALVDGLAASAPAELKELMTGTIEQAVGAIIARVAGSTVAGPATNGQPPLPVEGQSLAQPDSP